MVLQVDSGSWLGAFAVLWIVLDVNVEVLRLECRTLKCVESGVQVCLGDIAWGLSWIKHT